MSDLNVVAVINAKPGSEPMVLDALRALTTPTLAEEGCRGYDLYESAATPGTYVTVEKWRSQADLDAHLQTAHVATAFAAAGDSLVAPPSIHPLVPR